MLYLSILKDVGILLVTLNRLIFGNNEDNTTDQKLNIATEFSHLNLVVGTCVGF